MDMKEIPLFALTALAAAVSGCGEGSRGVELLRPPPAEQMHMSSYQPDNPFAQIEGGPFVRSTFSAAEGGYAIDVRDILVAPGQQASEMRTPGAAMVEVRQGSGIATVGGQAREVSMGTTFAVSEDETLRLEARDGPMILRAYLFKKR